MKKLLIAAVSLFLPAAAYCGASSFGEITTVAPSARANAMGDAYTAADGDTLGFYYNPAQTAPRSAAVAYQRGYSDGDGTGIFAASLPGALPGGYNLALGFAYYNAGDMDMYTNGGSPLTFNAEQDWLLQANVSRQVSGVISVGATAKVAHLSLFDAASGSALLWDVGALAKYPFANIGFAVQNVGQQLKLGDANETFPSSWRLGAYRGFALKGNAVNAAVDYVKYRSETPYLRLGGEFVYNETLAFRLGYEFRNSLAAANTLLYGIGLTLHSWTFDYALVPYQTLGATHRLSVTYKFETAEKVKNAPVPAPVITPAAAPLIATVSVQDSDGDGVADTLDKCPGTPAGTAVDAAGCPVDSDGDGVSDYLDKCPGTSTGTVVNSAGCPVDSDGDGVPDYLDKCPGTSTGTAVNANGCPAASTAEVTALDRLFEIAAPDSVTPGLVDAVRSAAADPGCPWEQKDKLCMKLVMEFDYDKAELKGEFSAQLKEIAAFLAANPAARIELRGYTDDKGDDDYNFKLSAARAKVVMEHFVSVEGTAAARLSAEGLGKAQPVSSNQTDEGRKDNRRVMAVLSMEGTR